MDQWSSLQVQQTTTNNPTRNNNTQHTTKNKEQTTTTNKQYIYIYIDMVMLIFCYYFKLMFSVNLALSFWFPGQLATTLPPLSSCGHVAIPVSPTGRICCCPPGHSLGAGECCVEVVTCFLGKDSVRFKTWYIQNCKMQNCFEPLEGSKFEPHAVHSWNMLEL